MKLLTLHDLNKEDSLYLALSGGIDLKGDIQRQLEPLLQALEAQAGEWMPDLVKSKRRRKYSRAAVWKALEERRDEYGSVIGLYHTTAPAVSLTLHLGLTERRPGFDVSLNVQPLTFFTEEERCRKFVDMVRAWASYYPVPYAAAHGSADMDLADFPSFGRDDETRFQNGHDKVYEVFWLNVFGPKLVATVGRERMLSTPAHKVEELPNGSILLVLWPTAADFTSEGARQAQARALVHLRPELDFPTVLRTLHERNTTLTPVVPHFHPDIAPLLERVLDTSAAISARPRKIAELNAYQPPEPDEWLPANGAFPSDVPDMKAALEHYSWLAEHLVVLLHTEVPSVFKETPESLTDADYYFWHWNFPETFERHNIDERAVPAVGAYLGQVMVRHLGGQWIPRKKLEEAQVRVGSRVWLPFLRAHRYMRSQQALLDYSLTQLYREAQRHQS
jgi:hypothetical protein